MLLILFTVFCEFIVGNLWMFYNLFLVLNEAREKHSGSIKTSIHNNFIQLVTIKLSQEKPNLMVELLKN